MNAKTTLALVLLAGVAALWYFKADAWAPGLGITPSHPEPLRSPAAVTLDTLAPAGIAKVEITFPSGEPLTLERDTTGEGWRLSGNWPPRKQEVEELVETLGTLRTRFHAIPLLDEADLARYGLAADQKPLVVKLTADRQLLTLTFGEPKPAGGETHFTRPGYVRVNDASEVLRLGPDVMPIVRRPPEAYRRRTLFPDIERVKLAGSTTTSGPFGEPPGDAPVTISLPGNETASIRVARAGPTIWNLDLSPVYSFKLVRVGRLPQPAILIKGGEAAVQPDRLADAWALDAPIRNRAEPAQLRKVLGGVSDLWVDSFAGGDSFDLRLTPLRLLSMPVDRLPVDIRTGLAGATESVTVEGKRGDAVTVRFGGIARVAERDETTMIPGGPPGAPPRPLTTKVQTVYRFARIDGNPQIFVVSAGKLPDLFASTTELADPQVARFAREEVREIVVRASGRPEVKLSLTKGDPKSGKSEEDRWFVDAKPNPLLADTARVNELLDRLSSFRAFEPNRSSYPSDPPSPETIITIATRDKRAEGEPEGPERKLTLLVGKPDYTARRLPVRLEGWPRVTLAEDSLGPDTPDSWVTALLFPNTVSDLLVRPAIAYRDRKLFDWASQLEGVSVVGRFALRRKPEGWKLTAPIESEADPGRSGEFASALKELTATEFLSERPTADELKSFGLDVPGHSVKMAFQGGREYTLELGQARPGKSEVFARLDQGAVFGLPNKVLEQLTTGVVGLLPLQVWSAQPDKITAVEVSRMEAPSESFKLVRNGSNWQITGPFSATVPSANAEPLLASLGNLTAVKYQALNATNPSEYGFDKPFLTVKITHFGTEPSRAGGSPVATSVAIGAPTPDGSGRYARLEGPNSPVFVASAAFIDAARTSPLELLDRRLLSLEPARVAKFRVATQDPDNSFTLSKDATGKWSAEGVTFTVDSERVSRLTSAATEPPITKLVAYGDNVKWADYGLEKPEVSVITTLSGDKPETHAIELGKAAPLGGRYARIDGGKAVAVIPPAAAESLSRKKFDYADRALLQFDPTTLNGITRKQGKEELELAPGAALGWDVIRPTKHKADQPFVDELSEALSRLRAERVAAYGKKELVFKEYGLEPPAATITVMVGDKAEQKTLRIGNHVNSVTLDGDRYASVESANAEVIVGVVPAMLVNKLLAPAVAFRDRSLAKFVDADKAVLERGDRRVSFAKVGVTWKVTEPISSAAESAELEALVADLGKLRADTWLAEKKGADLKSFGLDPPETKWTLSNGDSTVMVLLLGKKAADGRIHVATDKGDLIGLLDKPLTARVLAEYRNRKPWELDAAQITELELVAAGGKFTLEKEGATWRDTARPADAIDARTVNDLLGALASLQVERYAVDRGADPKLYGLVKPHMTLTVTSAGARRVLEVGGTVGGTEGRERYARVVEKDRSDVFVLKAADTALLTRDRSAYLMKK